MSGGQLSLLTCYSASSVRSCEPLVCTCLSGSYFYTAYWIYGWTEHEIREEIHKLGEKSSFLTKLILGFNHSVIEYFTYQLALSSCR